MRREEFFLPLLSQAALFLCLLAFAGCSPSSKNVGQQLDDVEGRVASTTGGVARTATIAEIQILDAFLLRIKELRLEWKDTLNESVNKLDTEQLNTLDNLQKASKDANGLLNHVSSMQDLAVLDVNAFLSKFGLPSDGSARRIEPLAQIYKPDGMYTYRVTLPLFGTGRKIVRVLMCLPRPAAGCICEPRNNEDCKNEADALDVSSLKIDVPPHGFQIDVPADELEGAFNNTAFRRIRLSVALEVRNTSLWNWLPWNNATTTEIVDVETGLFPRFPIRYWFAETVHSSVINNDPAAVTIVNADSTTIPGCGDSGCYHEYDVCAKSPPGTQMIDAFGPQDDFHGWGNFIRNPFIPPGASNLMCWTYQQHSHNQTRHVWFSARYHPLTDQVKTVYYTLEPQVVPGSKLGRVPETSNASNVFDKNNPASMTKLDDASAQSIACRISILSGLITAAVRETPPGGPQPNLSYQMPNGDTSPTPRPLQFGVTYFAPFHQDVNWELVAQPFTGDPITLLPTDKFATMISAKPNPPDRIAIKVSPPYQ